MLLLQRMTGIVCLIARVCRVFASPPFPQFRFMTTCGQQSNLIDLLWLDRKANQIVSAFEIEIEKSTLDLFWNSPPHGSGISTARPPIPIVPRSAGSSCERGSCATFAAFNFSGEFGPGIVRPGSRLVESGYAGVSGLFGVISVVGQAFRSA